LRPSNAAGGTASPPRRTWNEPPTPLPGWTVSQLVNHLVKEERWTPPLLAGATIEEVGSRFDGDLLGDDPVAAFDGAAAAALAVVRAEGALGGTVHLSFGDHPAREYAMQLAADHLVHAWDLARAIGADQTLDTDAVTAVREWFDAMETTTGTWGGRPAGRDSRRRRHAGAAARDDGEDTMTTALDAVDRFNKAFDAKDLDAIMAAMTPDCVFEDTRPPDGNRHVGTAAVRSAWTELFTASPHGAFTTEEVIPAGDRVVVRWRYDFENGHVRGVDIFVVRDGLVAEKLAYVKG
jgi:uncharacterized protein (TIGR03086 family)